MKLVFTMIDYVGVLVSVPYFRSKKMIVKKLNELVAFLLLNKITI